MHQKKCIRYIDDMPIYPGPSHWCISCGHKLSSEVYVSCSICKDVDLCLPCYCQGIDVCHHFKNHPVSVVIPSAQPGFESGWTLREELIFIESLSKEYAFNWENVSNELGTKNSEECRHHFMKCFIKAINAPDPRGGSSLDYTKSNKSKFIELNNNTEHTNSTLIPNSDVSAHVEIETGQYIISPSKKSTKLSATTSSPTLLSNFDDSAVIPLSMSSIFDDKDDLNQFNKFFRRKKSRPNNCITNGDLYGVSLGRKEFEPDPYGAPEMATLNLRFDEENETEESFIEKLDILQAYDSVITNKSSCESSLFKLNSFKNFIGQAADMNSINNGNKNQNVNQNFNISRSRRNPTRRKGISEPVRREPGLMSISKFSSIEVQNFGLIEFAEDPNEIEQISSIIHDTNSFLNKTRINQNDGGIPSGTALQAAIFHQLSKVTFLDEKEEIQKDTEDQNIERKEAKEEIIAEENLKSDEIINKKIDRQIENDETDEKSKKETKQEIELDESDEKMQKEAKQDFEENSDESKKDQSFSIDKKQTKKKNTSTPTRKICNKEKKLNLSIPIKVNLSEKDLLQWNDTVPLAESAHLFDNFYWKFMSKNEIDFIKEKKISASFFTKVKNSIIPFVIGNFNKEFILQKANELYPNFFIEASLIVDYFIDSKMYNYQKNNDITK